MGDPESFIPNGSANCTIAVGSYKGNDDVLKAQLPAATHIYNASDPLRKKSKAWDDRYGAGVYDVYYAFAYYEALVK